MGNFLAYFSFSKSTNRVLENALPGEIGLQETSKFEVPFAAWHLWAR